MKLYLVTCEVSTRAGNQLQSFEVGGCLFLFLVIHQWFVKVFHCYSVLFSISGRVHSVTIFLCVSFLSVYPFLFFFLTCLPLHLAETD